jgi:glycine cleavage system H protein
MTESGELYPPELKYNPEHTWLKMEGEKRVRVGITYYAQEQLKEIVFVELPELGSTVTHMEPFGVVESAKATNDLYSPTSGIVVELNHSLTTEPSLINRDPYGKGWMVVIEMSNPAELERLLSADKYQALVAGG